MDFVGGGARCSETASGGLKGSGKKIMRIFVKKIDQSLVKNRFKIVLFLVYFVIGHQQGHKKWFLAISRVFFTQFQPLL